jgi:hypothetical protein
MSNDFTDSIVIIPLRIVKHIHLSEFLLRRGGRERK